MRLRPSIELAGSPRDIGRGHGEALRAAIHDFLGDDLCRLNRILYRPTSLAGLAETIRHHAEIMARDVPDIFEEIRGLAEGADIDLDAALLLQLRREVVGYSKIPTAGDCTTLCSAGAGGDPILAQTIDLNGDLDDQMTVLRISHSSTGRRVLVVTFTGLLGYLGLNSDGTAIGINLVLGGRWRPGVPPYLAIRHLLDRCSDVDSCLTALAGLQLASSRSLTICDRQRAVTVELLDGRMAVLKDNPLVHTNHFLSKDFAAHDSINPFARNSSILRLNACSERFSQLSNHAGPDEVMAIFCREPIRVKANGNCRQERTVGAVVMLPLDGMIQVRCGDPASAITETFKLDS